MRHADLIAVLGAAVLCLSACTGEPDGEGSGEEMAAEVDEVPEPVASPVDNTPADTVPAAIRGEWGINAGDCFGDRGAAKGLMTVGANSLRFYEAVATLGVIEVRDADHIRADYLFEGEGETWTQGVDLSLGDDRSVLVRRDFGPDALPEPLEYERCD